LSEKLDRQRKYALKPDEKLTGALLLKALMEKQPGFKQNQENVGLRCANPTYPKS
jgi:hypothetical protein